MKLVEGLVTALGTWDVRYVFGVDGASVEPLHDAIRQSGGSGPERLVSVLASSEAGAASMADARARIHRTLGVCCSPSGLDMTHLAAAIAESFAGSVPLLTIVGQPPRALDSGLDAERLFGGICKHVWRIGDAGDGREFWTRLAEAARTALSGRPGPAVLLIPRDLYDSDVGPMPADFPRDLHALRPPTPAPHADVSRLFEALRTAHRPVLLAGAGLTRCSWPSWLLTFARAAGIPVVTTLGDPGAFPNDDPLWLGIVGATGHHAAHRYLAEEADLIVAVGAGLHTMTRQPLQAALGGCALAAVDVDANEQRHALDVELLVEADAGEVFRQLCSRWARSPFFHQAPRKHRPPRHLPAPTVAAAPLHPRDALALLEPWLPRGGHLLFDVGQCAATALHHLRIPTGTTSTVALGMGRAGWAIAGAVGALAGCDPSQRGMVLCDDGAFRMAGHEVHTAAALSLPILYVVFNSRPDVNDLRRGLGHPDHAWVGRAATPAELRQRLEEYHALGPRTGVLELALRVEEMPPFTQLRAGLESGTCQSPGGVVRSHDAAPSEALAG